MQSKIVILGTGGTIAGTAASAADAVGYTAAQLGIAQVVAAVPHMAGLPIECEQVAQLDSKDMDVDTWQRLAARCVQHLARVDVAGIVITHGTDTLEETAWFLHRVLAPSKPVVLTGAMRPATSLQADGPQNLLDAVCTVRHPGASGVVVVFASTVYGACDVIKHHTYRLDAFSAGDAGPLARIEEGRLRCFRAWPAAAAPVAGWQTAPAQWPRVEIVTSHAGADGALVDALVASGARGLVVAGTGNGTVHRGLEAALDRARARGLVVTIGTRCAAGTVVAASAANGPAASGLSPAKARVELLLQLLAGADGGNLSPGVPR